MSANVIIVGAGPAGLTTAYHLQRRGVPYQVLERGPAPGDSFARMRRTMTLVSPPFFSELPGLKFPPGSPELLPMPAFRDYLVRYAEHHRLNVRCNAAVTGVERTSEGFALTVGGERLAARFLVAATGVFGAPYVPPELHPERLAIPWMHAADYHEPAQLAGREVLIVGAGLSGQEIALDLARPVTMAARRPVKWIPNPILGVDVHWLAWLPEMIPVRWLPWLVGHLHEPASGAPIKAALDAGTIRVRPAVTRLEGDTAHFADGTHDTLGAVVLATGFRPVVGWLGGLEDAPGLFHVGRPFQRTFASRFLRGIRRDAAHVADLIASRA